MNKLPGVNVFCLNLFFWTALIIMSTIYASHFGINNIPYGIASSTVHPKPQCVTRINDIVVFLADLADDGLFDNVSAPLSTIFRSSTLNAFAALSKANHADVRSSIQGAYKSNKLGSCSESIEEVALHLPVHIGDSEHAPSHPRSINTLLGTLGGVPLLKSRPQMWSDP
jgi:hypothetical protein